MLQLTQYLCKELEDIQLAKTNEMATNGTNLILYYRGTGGTYVPFAASTNCSFDTSTSQIEVTSYASDWFKEFKSDVTGWTVTCDGLIAISGFDYKMMLDAQLNRSKITLRFQVGVSSSYTIYGRAYITSFNMNAPSEGVATYSITLTGDAKYSYYDPTACINYQVTVTSAPATIEWVACEGGGLKSMGFLSPTTITQCAQISGGLAQIFFTSGSGTITPLGYCDA
jgi:predicted secreted protein